MFLGVLQHHPGLRTKRQASSDREFTETAVAESSVPAGEANSNDNSVDSSRTALGVVVDDPNDEDQSFSKIYYDYVNKFWFAGDTRDVLVFHLREALEKIGLFIRDMEEDIQYSRKLTELFNSSPVHQQMERFKTSIERMKVVAECFCMPLEAEKRHALERDIIGPDQLLEIANKMFEAAIKQCECDEDLLLLQDFMTRFGDKWPGVAQDLSTEHFTNAARVF